MCRRMSYMGWQRMLVEGGEERKDECGDVLEV